MAVTKRRRRHRGSSSSPTAESARPSSGLWLAGLLVTAAAIVSFGNSVFAPFVLDDRVAILDNPSLHRLWPLKEALFAARESPFAGRPLVNLSFAVNYAVAAFDPRLYHAVNVALHVACALLLLSVIHRTWLLPRVHEHVVGPAAWMATTCALIWAVHPLNSEAVDYVTQRTELMMGLLYLLTLYCSIRSVGAGRPLFWQASAILACAAGMACKESMVTAPVMIVLYDGAYCYESLREAIMRRWRFYVGLASTWIVLVALQQSGPRIHSAGFSSGVSPWTYLLNQAEMIARYFRLSIWPQPLVVSYGYPRPLVLHDVWPAATLVAGLCVLAMVVYVLKPRLGFLGLWVFVTLAPTSSILPIATEVGAERRMYLPLAGLVVMAALLAAWSGNRVARRVRFLSAPPARPVAAGALVSIVGVALAGASFARGREYQSPLTLTSTLVQRWPTGHSHALLAADLIAEGRHDEAIVHLRQALDGDARAHYMLGAELFDRRQLDEARHQLQEFIRLEPSLLEVVDARDLLGSIALLQGRPQDAELDYRAALQMNPQFAIARAHLADALFAQHRLTEAIGEYRRYLQGSPNDVEKTANLGAALGQSGQDDEAIRLFRRVLELNPAHVETNRNLAALLIKRQAYDEALVYARRSVSYAPNDAMAHDLVGAALAFQSKLDEALVEFAHAVRLNPADPDAREHYATTAAQVAASHRTGRQ